MDFQNQFFSKADLKLRFKTESLCVVNVACLCVARIWWFCREHYWAVPISGGFSALTRVYLTLRAQPKPRPCYAYATQASVCGRGHNTGEKKKAKLNKTIKVPCSL